MALAHSHKPHVQVLGAFPDRLSAQDARAGRSFVRLEYQSTRAGVKAIYVLDNLWDGLGALTVVYPEIEYLFGKVTMYPSYDEECRNMILYFLNKHFPDPDRLVTTIKPLGYQHTTAGQIAYMLCHLRCACLAMHQ